MTTEQKKKTQFRTTSRWKNFRKRMKKERKVDFVTGKPLLKAFNVHHCDLDPAHYKDLTEENFFCLNRQTHEVVHWLYRYDWKEILKNLAVIMQKMDELNNK